MALLTALRETLVTAVRSGRLWLLQVVGNVVVFFLFVLFLHISESRWYSIVFDFLVLAVAVVLLLWLHAGTMRYFAEVDTGNRTLRHAFTHALRHLPAFFLWAAIFLLLRLLITRLEDYQYSLPGYMGSMMPRWMRRLFGEQGLYTSYDTFIAFLRWIVLPGFLLPLGVLCVERGFAGFLAIRDWMRMLASVTYWIVLVVASLIAVFCTDKLMGWHIDGSLTGEEFWLGFRLLIALLLAIFSWLWVCAILGYQRQKLGPRMSASGRE